MEVDFYTLERPVQDRFADATRAIGVPSPISRESAADHRAALWFVSAVVLFAGLVLLLFQGFGSLESPIALAPPAYAVAYVAIVFAATFCFLKGLAVMNARARVPYEPGLYLFPAGVFDARSEPIRVFLQPDLRGASVVGGSQLRVGVEGGEFLFRLPDAATAEQAKQALEQGREQYEQAMLANNRRERAMLDPLVDSGFSSPFSPKQRLVKENPLWARLAAVVALIAGCSLGFALWKTRNVASERSLYRKAVARNDVEAYRQYIARGGPRVDVSDVLLPRAELRAAMETGTVEALESFVAAHPATKIAGEVEGALQAAVNKELAESAKTGTVSALREFRQRRKQYAFIQPAVDAAMISTYRSLLGKFVGGKDPAVASFFERLLGYTKGHGPHVTVRFVRNIPDSVVAADTQVKLSAYFMGKQSVPSQYFVGDYAARREAAAGARIVAGLGSLFPADVVAPELAPTITDGKVPALSEPTLTIEYSPEMAGGYMSPKPRGVFVGVGMMSKATFRIPGDEQPLEVKSSLWRTPNPMILTNEGATTADVYEKMAGDSFAKLLKDILGPLGVDSEAVAQK